MSSSKGAARKLTAVLAFAAVCAGSGCSFLFVKRPPPQPAPTKRLDCSKAYAGPVVDFIIAGLLATRAVYAVSRSDRDYPGGADARMAHIGIGLGLAGLFGVSGGVGIGWVDECRAAIADRGEEERRSTRPFPPRRQEARPESAPEGADPFAPTDQDAAPSDAAPAPPGPPPDGEAAKPE